MMSKEMATEIAEPLYLDPLVRAERVITGNGDSFETSKPIPIKTTPLHLFQTVTTGNQVFKYESIGAILIQITTIPPPTFVPFPK